MSETPDHEQELFCVNHPNRPTLLRCNRCNSPICIDCARLTPTGYRCKNCISTQQKAFDTSTWYDYPLAFIISAGISLLGSYFVPRLGFFTLLVTPIVGFIIAEIIRFVTQKRRSKALFNIAATAAVLGAIPVLVPYIIAIFSELAAGQVADLFGLLFPVIWWVVYLTLLSSTVYYRLSGIQLKR